MTPGLSDYPSPHRCLRATSPPALSRSLNDEPTSHNHRITCSPPRKKLDKSCTPPPSGGSTNGFLWGRGTGTGAHLGPGSVVFFLFPNVDFSVLGTALEEGGGLRTTFPKTHSGRTPSPPPLQTCRSRENFLKSGVDITMLCAAKKTSDRRSGGRPSVQKKGIVPRQFAANLSV